MGAPGHISDAAPLPLFPEATQVMRKVTSIIYGLVNPHVFQRGFIIATVRQPRSLCGWRDAYRVRMIGAFARRLKRMESSASVNIFVKGIVTYPRRIPIRLFPRTIPITRAAGRFVIRIGWASNVVGFEANTLAVSYTHPTLPTTHPV